MLRRRQGEEIVLNEGRLKRSVIETSIQVCAISVAAKKIEVELSCAEEIVAKIDPQVSYSNFVVMGSLSKYNYAQIKPFCKLKMNFTTVFE